MQDDSRARRYIQSTQSKTLDLCTNYTKKKPKCKLCNIKTVNKTCQKRDLVEGC